MATERTPLLALQGLCAGYGGARVLDQLDLQLYPNETLVVMGRNGVGKTTLIETIMGLTDWHAGSIAFDGQAIERWPTHLRNRAGIGWVPQQREVFPSLTVEENLTVIARAGEWSVERVYELFPRLQERRKNHGDQLSGGEQQMLAMGRALMSRPKVLLLDEPSMGLSPLMVDKVFEVVRDVFAQGVTVLLVEQNASRALAIANRGYVMESGLISMTGLGQDLLNDPKVRAAYLGE